MTTRPRPSLARTAAGLVFAVIGLSTPAATYAAGSHDATTQSAGRAAQTARNTARARGTRATFGTARTWVRVAARPGVHGTGHAYSEGARESARARVRGPGRRDGLRGGYDVVAKAVARGKPAAPSVWASARTHGRAGVGAAGGPRRDLAYATADAAQTGRTSLSARVEGRLAARLVTFGKGVLRAKTTAAGGAALDGQMRAAAAGTRNRLVVHGPHDATVTIASSADVRFSVHHGHDGAVEMKIAWHPTKTPAVAALDGPMRAGAAGTRSRLVVHGPHHTTVTIAPRAYVQFDARDGDDGAARMKIVWPSPKTPAGF